MNQHVAPLLTYHVFVSSTWIDLQPERQAAEEALQRIREIKFIGMEYFGSRGEDTRNASLAEVKKSQLYLGIFGNRYGSGITKAEYQQARELELPCFIYIKRGVSGDVAWQDNENALNHLMDDLKKNHIVSTFENPDHLAALITADMHRWLTENIVELDSGMYPLQSLQQLLEGIRELSQIMTELLRKAETSIMRTVAVSGSNFGYIHTGDIVYKIFTESPQTIAQEIHIKDYETLIQERTKNFVGRQFVFNAIDSLLQDRKKFKSGYIIISGEPGIGKTALAAQLVKTHGYIHHFNIASQNIRTSNNFLSNACAQIIASYGLNYSMLPPKATQDSGFFSSLLKEAAEKTTQPLVIVVDALDEAEDTDLRPSENRLLLPRELPDHVFIIITTRPKFEYRLVVDNQRNITISANDTQNKDDVRRYINNFISANQREMDERMEAWGTDKPSFIEALLNKSEGNFMYLTYVLKDIRDGLLGNNNLGSIYDLPSGLMEYYRRHWREMQSKESQRFADYHKSVIGMLAVAREPVSVFQIVEWTRERWPHLDVSSIKDVIRSWREFLNEDKPLQGVPLYRIYHNSFTDFFREEVNLPEYHSIIARNALAKIFTLLDQ